MHRRIMHTHRGLIDENQAWLVDATKGRHAFFSTHGVLDDCEIDGDAVMEHVSIAQAVHYLFCSNMCVNTTICSCVIRTMAA